MNATAGVFIPQQYNLYCSSSRKTISKCIVEVEVKCVNLSLFLVSNIMYTERQKQRPHDIHIFCSVSIRACFTLVLLNFIFMLF